MSEEEERLSICQTFDLLSKVFCEYSVEELKKRSEIIRLVKRKFTSHFKDSQSISKMLFIEIIRAHGFMLKEWRELYLKLKDKK